MSLTPSLRSASRSPTGPEPGPESGPTSGRITYSVERCLLASLIASCVGLATMIIIMAADLLPGVFGVVGTLAGASVSGWVTWLLSRSQRRTDHAIWLRGQRATAYVDATEFLMRSRQVPDLLQLDQTWVISARLNVLGSTRAGDAFHALTELTAGEERADAVRALRAHIRHDLGSDSGGT